MFFILQLSNLKMMVVVKMTILPKKKQTQKEKNEASADCSGERPHSPVGGPGETRGPGVRRPGSPSGPPRWSSPPPLDHDRLPNVLHAVDGNSRRVGVGGGADESVSGVLHGSINNKRRLRERSPSHRNTRKQRHENLRGAPSGAGPSHGGRQAGFRTTSNITCASASDSRTSISHVVGTAGQSLVSELEELHSGYNSEDECIPRPREDNSEEVCYFLC